MSLYPTRRVWVYWNTLVRLSPCVRNYSFILWRILFVWFGMLVGHEHSFYILFTLVYATTHLSFDGFSVRFIFGMLVGHDARMCILYLFTGRLIFAGVMALTGVMALYDENSFYVLFTQLLIYPLADFVNIWYVGWAWCEDAHILPILWLIDFCRSYGPLWWISY